MGAERVSRESRVGYYLSSRAAQVSGWWWWWGWWWFGNHITPINHTFAKKNFSKTFWLISFKYYQRADNDKVRSRQWSVISDQSCFRIRFKEAYAMISLSARYPLLDVSLTWSLMEGGRLVEGKINCDRLAFKCTSFNPSEREREGTPKTVQIFGVGVDSVL